MTTKNVTSTTFNAANLYGVTSIDINANNNGTAKHTDGDSYPSSVTEGIKERSVNLNGVDLEDIRGIVSASAATLVCVLEGVDGDPNVTVTLTNAKPNDPNLESGSPGDDGSASVIFTGKSSDGSTDPLTITT